MPRLWAGRPGHYLLLVTVAALLYLPNLGGPSLWDIDEGNNSTCAAEMLASDNWVVPTFNYALRVDKPALLYWLQILGYERFGVSELAARLPSALAALLTVLLAYELGRSLFDTATALLGGVVLASASLFSAAAHFANPDALLNLCTVANLFCCWRYFQGGRGAWLLLSGVAAGVGVLAKGPVAVVLPCGVVVLYLLWSRQLRMLQTWYFLGGALVAGLVFAPWYAWVGVETKAEFLKGFFLKHNVGRFAQPMEGHSGGFLYYYPLVLLVGLAPWSAFLGPTVWYAVGRRAQADDPSLASYRFLGCWIGLYLLFFSLSGTKLPNYILPVYAPFALLTARMLVRWRRGEVDGRLVSAGIVCFGLIGVAVGAGLIVAGRLRFPGLEAWAALGLVPVVGAIVAWLWRGRQPVRSLAALATAAVVFLGTLAAWGVNAIEPHKAPRPLVQAIHEAQEEPEIRLACYRYFQPSVVFYAGRQVEQLGDEEKVYNLLRYPTEVYLLMPTAEWERLRGQVRVPTRTVARRRDLYRNCEVVVVTNR